MSRYDFSLSRAKKVKLVELPVHIDGQSCATCHNFCRDGFCDHKEVMMHVDGHWHCREWNRPDVYPVDINEPRPETKNRNAVIDAVEEADSLVELKATLEKLRTVDARLI